MDPFFKWVGGKRWLTEHALALFPAKIETLYCEPFLGAGAMFLALASAGRLGPCVLLSDSNPDLIAAWTAVRDCPAGLLMELDKHRLADSREHYLATRQNHPQPIWNAAQRGARFLYLIRAGFNGLWRVNKAGRMNTPWGKRQAFHDQHVFTALCSHIRTVSMLLNKHRVMLKCQDFETTILGCPRTAFIYADPPYIPRSDTASFTGYASAPFGDGAQIALSMRLRNHAQTGGMAWASNSNTARSRELYQGQVHEFAVKHKVSATAAGRGQVQELLINIGKDGAR